MSVSIENPRRRISESDSPVAEATAGQLRVGSYEELLVWGSENKSFAQTKNRRPTTIRKRRRELAQWGWIRNGHGAISGSNKPDWYFSATWTLPAGRRYKQGSSGRLASPHLGGQPCSTPSLLGSKPIVPATRSTERSGGSPACPDAASGFLRRHRFVFDQFRAVPGPKLRWQLVRLCLDGGPGKRLRDRRQHDAIHGRSRTAVACCRAGARLGAIRNRRGRPDATCSSRSAGGAAIAVMRCCRRIFAWPIEMLLRGTTPRRPRQRAAWRCSAIPGCRRAKRRLNSNSRPLPTRSLTQYAAAADRGGFPDGLMSPIPGTIKKPCRSAICWGACLRCNSARRSPIGQPKPLPLGRSGLAHQAASLAGRFCRTNETTALQCWTPRSSPDNGLRIQSDVRGLCLA